MYKLLLLFVFSACFAQEPQLDLQAGTFPPVTVTMRNTESNKFISLTKAWITESRRSGQQFEVTNIKPNSFTISGMKKNAFFYRERGEPHTQNAKIVYKITFTNTSYTINASVPEIYTSEGQPLKSTLPDYYNGSKLKDGYSGLEESIEATVNDIMVSYYYFIVNYR